MCLHCLIFPSNSHYTFSCFKHKFNKSKTPIQLPSNVLWTHGMCFMTCLDCEMFLGLWICVEVYSMKLYQWLAAGRWFSPSTPVSSTNKTYRHDINEILLKVVLNTITLTLTIEFMCFMFTDWSSSLSWCIKFHDIMKPIRSISFLVYNITWYILETTWYFYIIILCETTTCVSFTPLLL